MMIRFYHAFPENLENEDVQKWINFEEDTGVQEAIVDDEMGKNESNESEECNTPLLPLIERPRNATISLISFQK